VPVTGRKDHQEPRASRPHQQGRGPRPGDRAASRARCTPGRHWADRAESRTVLADPEGNEFCVVRHPV